MTSAPASAAFFAGVPIPVDPGQIDRELARLWKPLEAAEAGKDAAVTRACLANVVVYLPDGRSCERTRDLIPALGRRLPARVILLVESRTAGPKLAASITAVCHVVSRGAPPVCCEQITLEAPSIDLFAGAVAPLLVTDVPVSLSVPCSGGERLVDLLDDFVDRVIFDSRELPPASLERVLSMLEGGGGRAPRGADDLAWHDITGWRKALADIFEDPAALPILQNAEAVEVAHVEGEATRAVLLAGWFASRLGRRLESRFTPAAAPGESAGRIFSVRLESRREPGRSSLFVRKSSRANVLRIEYCTSESCVMPRTVPLSVEGDADLLGGAIERETHQGVLRGAVAAGLRLLPRP